MKKEKESSSSKKSKLLSAIFWVIMLFVLQMCVQPFIKHNMRQSVNHGNSSTEYHSVFEDL